MSTFSVEVVPVHLDPHPNADSLSVVHVHGYSVCVRTEDWSEGDLGAYIAPDSIVPDTEQYAFLNGHSRIKVKKLRGVYSMGMLVPAPEGAEAGDDVAEQLGIIHYDPPIKWFSSGKTGSITSEPPPSGFKPRYDVENFYRYDTAFTPGEEVIATEKIHGANARFTFQDGRFWAGSHNEWKIESDGCLWWVALKQCPKFMQFLQDHPGITAYGEVYGCVQDLQYGHKDGKVSLALFDIWNEGVSENVDETARLLYNIFYSDLPKPGWVNHDKATSLTDDYINGDEPVAWVPEVYRGPFDKDKLIELSNGPSLIPGANNIREGIVVIPFEEQYFYSLGSGRLQLKFVSNAYLEKV